MEVDLIEMTLGQRLKSIREDLKRNDKQWTIAFVADKIGVTKGAVSHYENDVNPPSTDILKSIAKLYKVSLDQLVTDKFHELGEQSLKYEIERSYNKKFHFQTDLPELDKGDMIPGKKAQIYLSQLPEKEAELYIPYYDVEITAGKIELYFDDVDEIPTGYIYAPQYRDCIACNVKGDSMYDRIYPGSRLYVYHLPNRKYIDYGQIYLVVLDGYRLLKYIHPHPEDESKVRLSSYNKHYSHWDIERADILNLFIVKGYENQNAM